MIYRGSHPDWSYSGEITFEEAYAPLIEKHFITLFNDSVRRVNIREVDPATRVCAFCKKREPEVTFKKEAHAIPACIGNRIYFSLEECDDCNEKYGDWYENHLGHMTLPERGLFGIPNRDGQVKWTGKDGEQQVTWDPDKGLVIATGGKKDQLQLNLKREEKEIEIVGPSQPHKPVYALKSLLRTCWMFLDDEQRKKNPLILEFIKDKAKSVPFVFHQGFFPGQHSQLVKFDVFERKSSNVDLPDLIIRLSVGHLILMWASPDKNSGEYLPFPLPEIRSHKDAPEPKLSIIKTEDLEYIANREKTAFVLNFKSIIEGELEDDNRKPYKPKFRKSQRVKLKLLTQKGPVIWSENLYIKAFNIASSDPLLEVSGPTFPVKFKLTPVGKHFTEGSQLTLSLGVSPGGHDPKNVVKAIDLLSHIKNSSTSFEILDENDKPIYVFNDPNEEYPFDFSFSKDVSQKLISVGDALNVEFQYPKKVTHAELDGLDYLYNVLVKKEGPMAGIFGFKLTDEAVDDEKFQEFLNGDGQIELMHDECEVELFDRKFTLPNYRGHFLEYNIVEKIYDDSEKLSEIKIKPVLVKFELID